MENYKVSVFRKDFPDIEFTISNCSSMPVYSPFNDMITILHDGGLAYIRWSEVSLIYVKEIK